MLFRRGRAFSLRNQEYNFMNKEFPESFSSQNKIWHQPPSLRLASIDRGVGWAEATFLASSEHLNPMGMLHGGIIAGLLDLIMANAAGSHTDPKKIRFAVTLSLSMNFISSASDGPLGLRAETTGGGKSTCFCDGRIEDMDGNLIATGQGAFKLMAPDTGAAPPEV